MKDSKISWTDHTFNPWRGCVKISPGCTNCYAETLSKRNPGTLGIWGSETSGATRVVASEAMWREPVKWNEKVVQLRRQVYKDLRNGPMACNSDQAESRSREIVPRPRVFCASLCDVFEDWRGPMVNSTGLPIHQCSSCGAWFVRDISHCPPHGFSDVTMQNVRRRLFDLIDDAQNLDWLLLTKRPENIRSMWVGARRDNVWLGTSVATQEDADRNIPELLKCRELAANLFVSVEPMVSPVDLARIETDQFNTDARQYLAINPLVGTGLHSCKPIERGATGVWQTEVCPTLDWVIVGGESGQKARPCHVDWIRSIVNQCSGTGVACHVKQLGSAVLLRESPPRSDDKRSGMSISRFNHPKAGDPSEWPEDLRVQEFPTHG